MQLSHMEGGDISKQVEVEVEYGYSGCLMQLLVQPNLLEDYDKPAKEEEGWWRWW